MLSNGEMLLVVLAIAATVFFTRAVPFVLFGGRTTPPYFIYLGKVLPFAIIALLIVLLLAENDSAFLSLWFARSDCCPCCGFGASLETEQLVEYRRRHRSLHGVGAMCLCIKTPFRKRGFLNCEGEKGDHKRRYLVPSCLRAFVPSCLRAFGNGTIKGDDS